MDALMLSLLIWLGMNSDFNLPKNKNALPRIEYKTADTMKVIVYGAIGPSIPKEVKASYDDRKNILYLLNGFNPKDLSEQRTMLHELVHFLQFYNKRKYKCRNVAEVEAFRLATKWGQEQGIKDDYAINWIYGPRGCVFEIPPDFYH